jgi:hypothetical protein
MFDKVRAALRRFNDAAPQHRRIRVSEQNLALVSAKSDRILWQVRWGDLKEIVAYKVDAITVDHICLGFRSSDHDWLDIATEETPGWEVLCDELDRRFGVAYETWFAQVAFPAFARNLTVLWRAA